MRLLIISVFILSNINVLAQELINGSFEHDGVEREYIMYIPASYEAGNALVLNFHGYGSSAQEQMLYSDFLSIADEAGFLPVHPNGTQDITGTAHWNVGWGLSTVDDVGFISALIDNLHTAHSFNLERVYSTGMSNGGFMSYHLACELSEKIAAIASVTGTMNNGAFATCNPSHPMPVMEIHGTADGTVAYDGTAFFEGTEEVVGFWAEFNDISTPAIITDVPNTDPDDECIAERWLYENGTSGVDVELYKVIGGAHTWPGADFIIGITNQDFNASEIIWEFFSKYDINGEIIPNGIDEQMEDSSFKIYPNPSIDILNVEFLGSPRKFKLINAQGQIITEGVLNQGRSLIQLEGMSPGNYQIVLGQDQVLHFVISNTP